MSVAAALRASLIALALPFLLGGCSTVSGWFGGSADRAGSTAASAPAAAAAPGSAASAPAEPAYVLDIDAPDELRGLLGYLDLSRFQALGQGSVTSGAITRQELDRLVAAAPAQARGLLETAGYFEAEIRTERTAGTPPHVKLIVEPGQRVTIDSVEIEIQGELRSAGDAGDAHARATIDSLRHDWPLEPGEPFTQTEWTDAKASTLTRLRGDGYPLATWESTSAQIDPATRRARLHVVAQSGPVFHFGNIAVRGLKRYERPAVVNLRNFRRGEVYSESVLAEFQDRLQKSGLFETANVTIEPDRAKNGDAPVVVRVRELPQHQATTGIGISANTGPRLSLEHVDRRVFGWNATSKNTIQLGRDESSWDGEIVSHAHPGPYRDLVAINLDRLDAADQVVSSWRLRAGRSRDTQRLERLYYAELIGATTTTEGVSTRAEAVSLNYNWVWRDLDSVLLPTRGLATSAELGGGYAFNNTGSNGPFVRALGRAVAYVPLGLNWYSQFRLEAGKVFTRSSVGIPDPLLFRAGGDDSVRGYGYRTLGPTVDGVLVSGRTLFTSSAELARPISKKLPSVWWAVFVDAGNAANSWAELEPALGYGVGVRWRSPIGPLRVDVAYGQEVRSVRLHLSVGIAL